MVGLSHGPAGGVQVVADLQQFGRGAAAFLGCLGDLVVISHLIDQLGVERLAVQERSLVDQLAERRRIDAAALRDARDELFMKVPTSASIISRCGSVKPCSVKVFMKLLYSSRWRSSGFTPSSSSAPRAKGTEAPSPVRPTRPTGWSQMRSKALAM